MLGAPLYLNLFVNNPVVPKYSNHVANFNQALQNQNHLGLRDGFPDMTYSLSFPSYRSNFVARFGSSLSPALELSQSLTKSIASMDFGNVVR
jgi:hypothetical protein